MTKVVKSRFVLSGPNGLLASFVPGDELPAWAEELVTNPDLLEDRNGSGPIEDVEVPEEPTEDLLEDSFDPADHTVDEILEYLSDADPDEVSRVVEAERTGKNRKTIVGSSADDLIG